jgi:hypothetical protein
MIVSTYLYGLARDLEREFPNDAHMKLRILGLREVARQTLARDIEYLDYKVERDAAAPAPINNLQSTINSSPSFLPTGDLTSVVKSETEELE